MHVGVGCCKHYNTWVLSNKLMIRYRRRRRLPLPVNYFTEFDLINLKVLYIILSRRDHITILIEHDNRTACLHSVWQLRD